MSLRAACLVAATAGIAAAGGPDSTALATQGIDALRAGDLATAESDLEQAVAADAANHVALYYLAVTRHAAHDDDGAEDAIDRALGLADAVAYHVEHGLVLAARGHATPAIALLAPALAREPRLAGVPEILGKAYEDTGAPVEAAKAYSIGCRLDESASCAALAALYLRWGYTDQAIQVAAQAAPGATGADAASLSLTLGRAWAAHADLDKAIAAFGQALDAAPDLVDARLDRGLAYAAKGDRASAKADLEGYLADGKDDLRHTVARTTLSTLGTR